MITDRLSLHSHKIHPHPSHPSSSPFINPLFSPHFQSRLNLTLTIALLSLTIQATYSTSTHKLHRKPKQRWRSRKQCQLRGCSVRLSQVPWTAKSKTLSKSRVPRASHSRYPFNERSAFLTVTTTLSCRPAWGSSLSTRLLNIRTTCRPIRRSRVVSSCQCTVSASIIDTKAVSDPARTRGDVDPLRIKWRVCHQSLRRRDQRDLWRARNRNSCDSPPSSQPLGRSEVCARLCHNSWSALAWRHREHSGPCPSICGHAHGFWLYRRSPSDWWRCHRWASIRDHPC